MNENIDLKKIKGVRLNILWDGCSEYQNQGVFENLEECLLHILFYEEAILKKDVCSLLDELKEIFNESNKN